MGKRKRKRGVETKEGKDREEQKVRAREIKMKRQLRGERKEKLAYGKTVMLKKKSQGCMTLLMYMAPIC